MNLDNEKFKEWFNKQKNLNLIEFGEREPDLIEGVLPSGNIVFITGQPKDGKSLIVQHWAHSVATGNDWNGHSSAQGAVFYLYPDGEHPRYLAERIKALEAYTGVPVDYENALRFSDSFSLTNADDVANVLAGIEFAGLRLLIIDTIAAATPGLDLNNAKEISQISCFAKEITKKSNGKTTVVIVAHSTKSNSKGVSGSTQLQAMASITYSVVKKGGAKTGFTYQLRVVESRHSAGDFEADFIGQEVAISEKDTGFVLTKAGMSKSNLEQIKNELKTTFADFPRNEWIPQSAWVIEFTERTNKHPNTAYRWLKDATELGLLVAKGERKGKAFCIPNSHLLPNTPNENTQPIPTTPPTLKSGDWEVEEELV